MALSAALTGIGGSLFAQYFLYLDPTFIISPELSFQFALLAAVGGLGTAIGPVLGSFLITPMSELLRSYLGNQAAGLHLVIYSALLIVSDALFPGRDCRSPHTPCEPQGQAVTAIVTINNVSHRFGSLWAVRDVSFSVERGELLGLIGPNGAGKSTLFNLIAGALIPTEGEIIFDGQKVSHWRSHRIARVGIARTFQIPKPYRQLSVVENVMLTAFQQERSVNGARALAIETLADVGLTDYVDVPVTALTVGLLKRLEVARALAMRPKLVLFDEIMAGLTPTEVGTMTKFVGGLPARGITVIWVEHVLHAIMKTASRIMVLNRGELIANGVPAKVARDPAVVKAVSGRGDEPCLR